MTTPDQARGILSAQPQIAYALMTLMVKLNVVNLEVLQVAMPFQNGSQPWLMVSNRKCCHPLRNRLSLLHQRRRKSQPRPYLRTSCSRNSEPEHPRINHPNQAMLPLSLPCTQGTRTDMFPTAALPRGMEHHRKVRPPRSTRWQIYQMSRRSARNYILAQSRYLIAFMRLSGDDHACHSNDPRSDQPSASQRTCEYNATGMACPPPSSLAFQQRSDPPSSAACHARIAYRMTGRA